MPAPVDLTGERFGQLTVLGEATRGRHRRRWNVACDCGRTKVADGGNLRNGNTRSCGCLKSAMLSAKNLTHGRSLTTEWVVWTQIFQRCYNPLNPAFHRYGGRGIRVCDRWRESFENFFADMGARPPGLSLDRIDNDKGYSPENCRWATRAQQASNRSVTITLTFGGETLPLVDWAERLDIRYHTLIYRVKAGWPIERALTQPERVSPLRKSKGKT